MKSSISIPDHYFRKMAKQDYANWRSALPREFLQNSIDAGAKNIEINIDQHNRTIVVADDGHGMSEDTIVNKLLVLGGSHKESQGVGAFGKAKELLYFSWSDYAITSNNIEVCGRASDYSIEKYDKPIRKGTESVISIPDDEDINKLQIYFINVAKKMQVKANIIINNRLIKPDCHRGKLKKETSWYKVYQNKSHDNSFAMFRINGIWMFDRYIGDGFGQVIIEMGNDSIKYLTSNRDNLKIEYINEIDQFINELTTNKKSALDDHKDDIFEKIEGEGEIKLKQELKSFHVVPDTAYAVSKMLEQGETEDVEHFLKDKISSTDKQVCEIQEKRIENFVQNYSSKPNEKWQVHISQEEPIMFLGYNPDFILHYKNKTFRIKQFMQTKKAISLAKIWTEIVKQVMLDNNIYEDFTAGFTFDPNMSACNVQNAGKTYILLNPFTLGKEAEETYVLSDRNFLVKNLISYASHEIAHLYVSSHNEDFVNLEMQIRAKTWKNEKIYKQIGKMN